MWQYNTDYLCHHGILGQKWGIRRFQNADGSLTKEGRERYGYSEKKIAKSENKIRKAMATEKPYGSDLERNTVEKEFSKTDIKQKMAKNREELRSVNQKVVNEENKIFEEFNNKQTREQYDATAEIASALTEVFSSKNQNDVTIDDAAWWMYLGCYEDGGQGRCNAYSLYAYKHGKEKECEKLVKETTDARTKNRETYKKDLQDIGLSEKLSNSLSYTLSMVDDNDPYPYKAEDGCRLLNAKYDKKKLDSNINFANKIVNNLKPCQDNYGWYYLSRAIEDLGYDSAKVNSLSSSDWNKINAKVNELKKHG